MTHLTFQSKSTAKDHSKTGFIFTSEIVTMSVFIYKIIPGNYVTYNYKWQWKAAKRIMDVYLRANDSIVQIHYEVLKDAEKGDIMLLRYFVEEGKKIKNTADKELNITKPSIKKYRDIIDFVLNTELPQAIKEI